MIYPIQFTINKNKIIEANEQFIKNKIHILTSLVPVQNRKYKFTDEKLYNEEYKKYLFAITTKRAGWDCLRHYEILMNGCIPIFENIEYCPKNTMFILPKQLLIE